ncbi:hypothetical protein G6F64_002263 [Rhizopus arrhizus]|uniref:Steroid 5-alpha reductase C-terminal domain-containing protein n=1 Tax=Rhizopus oryzae TaxID=64495 RepID=A0A9P6XGL7_RHIOR|nr:hypothetical protein G6F23_000231 [Rhizopus arrhizus]KAG1313432.1 hypothetical protein G6F64_002263 [Rhizopus arrhizus]
MNYETVVTWLTENDTHFPFNATWEHVKSIMQNAIKELWNTNITSIVYKIINNPHILCEYYKNYDSFVIASFLSTTLAIIHYISSEITHDYSQVDRAWSFLPVIYAWHFTIHDYLSTGLLNVRLVAASIIISLWGARLTYNFARKGGYYSSGQDYRYPYLLEKVGPVLMAVLNITFIATIQNFLLLLLASPLYIVSQVSNKTSCLSMFDWMIIATHLSLLFIEAVADEQQYAFQTAKHALLEYLQPSQLKDDFKNGFLWHSGLFQYSRHPNFFAEMAMWWVIYFFSVSAIQEATGLNGLSTFFNWTIAGPAALTAVIYSSTRLTESISSGKYPNYSVYQKNVNKFLPWFPSKDQTSTKPSSKKD